MPECSLIYLHAVSKSGTPAVAPTLATLWPAVQQANTAALSGFQPSRMPRKKPAAVQREEMKELLDAKTVTLEFEEGKPAKQKSNKATPILPYGAIGVKIHMPIFGLLAMLASLVTQNTFIILGGMGFALFGLAHVIVQALKNPTRSSINYAMGVTRFNKGKFKEAQKYFIKAAALDPKNKLAAYAVDKVKEYA